MKNPGRSDMDPAEIRGLPVMNQHVEREPAKRPALYAENEHDYSRTAEEEDTSLLGTWDLFLVIRAVEDGRLNAEEARELIERPGLVVGPPLA